MNDEFTLSPEESRRTFALDVAAKLHNNIGSADAEGVVKDAKTYEEYLRGPDEGNDDTEKGYEVPEKPLPPYTINISTVTPNAAVVGQAISEALIEYNRRMGRPKQ